MFAHASTSRKPAAGSKAFTLIELLAVMMILGILMALVIGVAKYITRSSDIESTRSNMSIIMAAIREYRQDADKYPTSQADLVAELKSVEMSRKQIDKLAKYVWSADNTEFLDAWGQPIVYSPTGGRAGAPGLTSPGPDGDIDTKEDNVRFD